MIDFLHQLSFGLMIFAALLAIAVATERMIFTAVNLKRANRILKDISQHDRVTLGRDLISESYSEILSVQAAALQAEQKQDRSDAIYLHVRDQLNRRMWTLDTVVTAAPLLGLLGTIFGIVDTFLIISQSGMSDPQGISAGIGTALYATALGISVALTGVLALNFLSDQIEKISERLKMIILRSSSYSVVRTASPTQP
jgi:biopolymer transport protein ExbB